jgi:hypothetical protein
MNVIGQADLLFVTLDTLRFDVAQNCFQKGQLPNLSHWFPHGWEERHTPGSFTYAAHHAFFAGYLPTPANKPKAERRFAARFAGSESTGPGTFTFEEPDLVTALRGRGYHTICIGGVGFFNQQTALSRVLPGLFDEAHWSPAMGVTDRASTANQFTLAARRLAEIDQAKRIFLFINISAIHQPNKFYLEGQAEDTVESQAAALRYVDSQWPILHQAIDRRGSCFAIVCSDHGTLYGEQGWTGHRLAHPHVWTVPYAECRVPALYDLAGRAA